MTITYDTSLGNSSTFAGSLTTAATLAATANRAIVSLAWSESSSTTFPSAATWNAVSLTEGTTFGLTTFQSRLAWKVGDANIASGLQNLVSTWNDANGKPRIGLASYNGVASVSNETTFAFASGATLTPSFIANSISGDTVVLSFYTDGLLAFAGTGGTTVRYTAQVGGYGLVIAEKVAAGATTTLNLSTTGATPSFFYGASLSLSPASGAATAVTMTGPSGGTVSVASTNFTVGANGTITGTVIVTPSDSAGGGTFTPATVSISSTTTTGTFTYTPASVGAKTISVTNNGALTNPANITYTATAASSRIFLPNWGLSGLGSGGPFFHDRLQ